MKRARGVLAVLAGGSILFTGCGAGEAPSGQPSFTGPDDTSNLWTALRWGIEVDYPFYATVAELADEADLVVRGRVVDVARHGTDPTSDNADITIEVERVLSDPEGRKPTSIVLSIPFNWQTDIARIDAEAPKPQDLIVAVAELHGEPGVPLDSYDEPQNAGAPTEDASRPPLFGMVSNDSVIDFRGGVSYTPFNDFGEDPKPGDPYRGHTLAELEAAFGDAASS